MRSAKPLACGGQPRGRHAQVADPSGMQSAPPVPRTGPRGAQLRDHAAREGPKVPPAARYYAEHHNSARSAPGGSGGSPPRANTTRGNTAMAMGIRS